jgi:hypothetical protein
MYRFIIIIIIIIIVLRPFIRACAGQTVSQNGPSPLRTILCILSLPSVFSYHHLQTATFSFLYHVPLPHQFALSFDSTSIPSPQHCFANNSDNQKNIILLFTKCKANKMSSIKKLHFSYNNQMLLTYLQHVNAVKP